MRAFAASFPDIFDVIVTGAGHAGCEAAMATSIMGLSTLLITSNVDRIGHLSCNPAIGGLGKSHMVHEIDALGGSMARWTDEAAIQVRTLNAGKGPAVRADRAQADREVYMHAVKRDIFAQPNLFVLEDMVEEIYAPNGRAEGVVTVAGLRFLSRAVLLTTGTFLSGRIHIGEHNRPAGRLGDIPAVGLSASLRRLGLTLGRFMTCTVPRIAKNSVDYEAMQEQPGDNPPPRFSVRGNGIVLPQVSCHLTYTNAKTHEIIAKALSRSPMYNGAIPGPGPRYCPSIEDKIARFPDKERHQIFVEPEGLNSPEAYPNNIPTGLPLDVQVELLHSIPGLERAQIIRPGYAVEYDVVPPTQLSPTLECKTVPGLWCAGQINGSSGYEEAAAQGLWAACNIFRSLAGLSPFTPGRDQAYMTVLVDDLVTKGTDEPYRMLTSRAEHRLLLRQSNADERLTPLCRELGLVSDEQWQLFCESRRLREELERSLQERRVSPDAALRELFTSWEEPLPSGAVSLGELFRRPFMDEEKMTALWPEYRNFPPAVRAEVETRFRYQGYVDRQRELAERGAHSEKTLLPPDLDYEAVPGLRREAVEKLSRVRPLNLGQAARIPGITPAALTSVEIFLRKQNRTPLLPATDIRCT